MILRGKCFELFEVVDAHVDDYTSLLNGQKKHASAGKRNMSAHRLLTAISVTAPTFLPCLLRKDLLEESSVKALPFDVLVSCVIQGELSREAMSLITRKGAGPPSEIVKSLLASELLLAERQVVHLMKKLKEHFTQLSKGERTGLSGATIQDQRSHWLAFAPIQEHWEWTQYDAYIVRVKQRLGSVSQVGRAHNTTDRNPRRVLASTVPERSGRPVRRSLETAVDEIAQEDGIDISDEGVAHSRVNAEHQQNMPGNTQVTSDSESESLKEDSDSLSDSLMGDHGDRDCEIEADLSDDGMQADPTPTPGPTESVLFPSDRAEARGRREATLQRKAKLLKRTEIKRKQPMAQPSRKRRRSNEASQSGNKLSMEDDISAILSIHKQTAAHALENQRLGPSGTTAAAHQQSPDGTERHATGGRTIMPAETFKRSMDIMKTYKNDPTVEPKDLRSLLITMAGCTESEALAMVPNN